MSRNAPAGHAKSRRYRASQTIPFRMVRLSFRERHCFPVFSGGSRSAMRFRSSSVSSYCLSVMNVSFPLFFKRSLRTLRDIKTTIVHSLRYWNFKNLNFQLKPLIRHRKVKMEEQDTKHREISSDERKISFFAGG